MTVSKSLFTGLADILFNEFAEFDGDCVVHDTAHVSNLTPDTASGYDSVSGYPAKFKESSLELTEVDGNRVQQSDRLIIIRDSELGNFSQESYLVIDNEKWRVIGIDPIQGVITKIQIRKGG